jgi:hypothetical protein
VPRIADVGERLGLVVSVTLVSGETAEFTRTLIVENDYSTLSESAWKDYCSARKRLLLTAQDLGDAREFDLAARLLGKLLENPPTLAQELAIYGRVLLGLNRLDDAIIQFRTAENLSGNRVDYSVEIERARYALVSQNTDRYPEDREIDHEKTAVSNISLQPRELLMQFESLGFNCEFGFVQRHFGCEPLGLLRFAHSPLNLLVSALERNFDGVGSQENTILKPTWGKEFGISDTRYNFLTHTFVYEGDPGAENFAILLEKQCKRLKFLARKLLQDLHSGEKIFLYFDYERLTNHACEHLLSVLTKYGKNRLLCVRKCEEGKPPGSVEVINRRLLLGYIESFSRWEAVPLYINYASWLQICAAAHRVFMDSE